MSFMYHKWNLLWYEKVIILHLSYVLPRFLMFDMHGNSNYDVTSNFSDVTSNAISAFGYTGIISSCASPSRSEI